MALLDLQTMKVPDTGERKPPEGSRASKQCENVGSKFSLLLC